MSSKKIEFRRALARMFHTRAAAGLVAQISNLLYRRFLTCWGRAVFGHPADWKSAIQQVRNLRYVRASAGPATVTHHAANRGYAKSRLVIAPLLAAVLAPSSTRACACGCGVFDVGTSSMFPEGPGGMAFLEYDYQDQDRNWNGSSRAPAADNPDKEIRTHFATVGLQYLFSPSWGLQAEVPYANRYFKTTGGATGTNLVSFNWGDLGDIRVKGIYTGFSPDLSSGVSFGLKLPTGDYTHGGVDRDSQIGSGSTDLLLGGFHRHRLTKDDYLNWFAQAELDLPMLTRGEYRPGTELDAAAGIYSKGWSFGRVTITPVAQVIGSERTRDTGANSAHPVASGYQRILLSPGLEVDVHPFRFYADAELPVYQHVTGNQVVAPVLFKVVLSYMF